MSIFRKQISFQAPFTEQTFNDAHAHITGINGRLSGFIPVGVLGDPASPGITVIAGATTFNLIFNVNLSSGSDEEIGNPISGASYALANGVVLETEGAYNFSATRNFISNPLSTPDDPLVIFVTFDSNPANLPVFDVSVKSVVDASPFQTAQLAIFNVASQLWEPSDQVSVRGAVRTAIAASEERGGFVTARQDSVTLQVGTGTIITPFGRVVNKGLQLVQITDFPSIPPAVGDIRYRNDLLVVIDRKDETLPIQLKVLKGLILETVAGGGPPSSVVANTAVPEDETQIPIASFIVSTLWSGVSEVRSVQDRRPILAWQTDVVGQNNALILSSPVVKDRQPGIIFESTEIGTIEDWETGVFKSSDPTLPVESRLSIGLIKDEETKTITIAGGAGTQFNISVTDFVPRPYISKRFFTVLASTVTGDYVDVTNDTQFGVLPTTTFSNKFDFLNGKFHTAPALTFLFKTTVAVSQTFIIKFRQVNPYFSIAHDGTRLDPTSISFSNHISAANTSAHTSSNLLYDNTAGRVATLLATQQSVQRAIDEVAVKAFGAPTGTPTTSIGNNIALCMTFQGEQDIPIGAGTTDFDLSMTSDGVFSGLGGIIVPANMSFSQFTLDISMLAQTGVISTKVTGLELHIKKNGNGLISAGEIAVVPALISIVGTTLITANASPALNLQLVRGDRISMWLRITRVAGAGILPCTYSATGVVFGQLV